MNMIKSYLVVQYRPSLCKLLRGNVSPNIDLSVAVRQL
jgi:hypothetical protein